MRQVTLPYFSSISAFYQKHQRTVLATIHEFSITLLLFSVLLGTLVAIVTILFEKVIIWLPQVWTYIGQTLSLSGLPIWTAFAPVPCVPLLLLCFYFIPNKRQSGPADTIVAVNLRKRTIDVKSGTSSVFGAMLSVGAGFPVGQYGPFVLLGSILGEQFHRIPAIRPAYVHISIGSAVAAAIAVIFHAPIAGVVFAHEVLFRFFSVRAFAPITVCAVTAYAVSTKVFNHGAFFTLMPYHEEPNLSDYNVILFAAMVAGIIAVLFINGVFFAQQKTHNISVEKRFLLVALCVACVAMVLPEVLLSGDALVQTVFYQPQAHALLFLFGAKLILTILCLGSGLPGGIFSPSLSLGMLLGLLLAQFSDVFLPTNNSEIIAVTTMAAFTGAVMGAPITMILIIVEMTDDYNIASGVMLAVVVANIITYRFLGASSFYDMQLKNRGLDMDVGREKLYLMNETIEKLTSKDYLAINVNTSLDIAKQTLVANNQHKAYVVDNHQYVGVITMLSIEHALKDIDPAEPILDNAIVGDTILYEATSIWHALEAMQKFEGSHMAVIKSTKDPTLVGVLYEHRLINKYMTTVNKQRNLENAVTP